MVVSTDEGQVVNITIDGQRMEQVKNFKYLGLDEDGYNLVDVKTRIILAKEAFNKRKELLTKGGLSRTLQKNGKGIGVVLYGLRVMDVEKEGNKQIGSIPVLPICLFPLFSTSMFRSHITQLATPIL